MSEKKIFGHLLSQSDWDAMDDKEKDLKSQRIMEIVKYRLQKRYNEI
jgi:hypothetical protein